MWRKYGTIVVTLLFYPPPLKGAPERLNVWKKIKNKITIRMIIIEVE